MTKTVLLPDLTEEEHRRIKAAAAAAGWPLGALVHALLRLWLAGRVKVGPAPKPKRGEKN